jgi:hypothetical protein
MRIGHVVVAAAFLVAMTSCGDDDPPAPEATGETGTSSVPEGPTTTTTTPPAPAAAPPDGALELSAEVPTRIPAALHTWQFAVTNTTEAPVTLTFPTAQRGDAVIEGDDGTSVHRWSADRFFTQQVHEVALAPGQSETIELADDLTGVEPGYYRVVLAPAVLGEIDPIDRSIRIVEPGT